MANVFRKLIRKELGDINYHRYSSFIKKDINNRSVDSQTIFNDMYEKLKCHDLKSISKMHNRLNDTMLLAFRITKNFFFAFLFYLIASLYLFFRDMSPELTVISLILVNICFIYKTYEFISNKFCYIDAQIILVYKAVLDRIIINERKGMSEK
ncbi:MAG: hypothetical protein GX379_00770 [Clostridiales bacterium]|jgi:hypothetical protein|nr:hypothetical protein [Clostridiales bacterium]